MKLQKTAILLSLIIATTVGAEDLRKQFGTKNSAAAENLNRAIKLKNAGKNKDALQAVNTALKSDLQLPLAIYWKGIILSQLGDIEEALECYTKCYQLKRNKSPNIKAGAAFNVGLVYSKLEEYEKSNPWYSRAILADPENTSGLLGDAYFNTSCNNANLGGSNLSAFLTLLHASKYIKTPEIKKQITELMHKARNEETGKILYFPEEAPGKKPGNTLMDLAYVTVSGDTITEEVSQLHIIPGPGCIVLAVCRNEPFYYLIKCSKGKAIVKKIKTKHPILCVSLGGGIAYAVTTSPSRLRKLNIKDGEMSPGIDLKSTVPSEIALFPKQNLVFFPTKTTIEGIDLKNGKRISTEIPGQIVAAHPSKPFLYSCTKAETIHASSNLSINGGFLHIHGMNTIGMQSMMVKSVIAGNKLLPAEMRLNAASNARQLKVSPDGKFITTVGWDGWRPSSYNGPHGYGVAVFRAADFENLFGFYKSEAFLNGSSFCSSRSLLAIISKKQARIFSLGNSRNYISLNGSFSGVCTWGAKGNYLLVGNSQEGKGGITILRTRPFSKAIGDDTPAAVREYNLKNGRLVKSVLSNDALFAAIINKDMAKIKKYIKAGGNLNVKRKANNWTALKTSLFSRNYEITKLLVKSGADVNIKDGHGIPLLYSLRDKNQKNIAEFFLKNGANPEMKLKNGDTMLTAALRDNKAEFSELLIKYKADVNAPDSKGDYPIHFALLLRKQAPEVVKLLLAKKADPNAINTGEKGRYHKKSPLILALDCNRSKVAELLIANKADVNLKNPFNYTPLAAAICRGNPEMIKMLLEKNVDPEVKDAAGRTAISQAVDMNKIEIVKLLVDRVKDFNSIDKRKRTPLMKAIYRKNPEVIRILLKHKASTDGLSEKQKKQMEQLLKDEKVKK